MSAATIIAPTPIDNNVILPPVGSPMFPALALQYVNHWVTHWVPGFNNLASVVYQNGLFTAAKAQIAQDAAHAALAAQAAAEVASGARLWQPGGSYLAGTPARAADCVYAAADPNLTYRCIADVSGSATAPRNDPAHWVALRVTHVIVREAAIDLGEGTDIDLSLGGRFRKTITGSTALTVSNVPAAGTAATFELVLTNAGGHTLTLWPGIQRPQGVMPILTPAGRDRLAYLSDDGGLTWDETVIALDAR